MHQTATDEVLQAQSTPKDVIGSQDINGKMPQWQVVASRHREQVLRAIPQEWKIPSAMLEDLDCRLNLPAVSGILTSRELEITALSATKLLEFIHNRTYSAVEVTLAFCKRAAIAHQAVNCLAMVLFEQALADAAELDRYIEVNGRAKGPLHGLPISVKEHVDLFGTPSTAGLVSQAEAVSSEDAMIVKVLREAGAVFHVKTTNPQTLMALETESNLYGVTLNPHNINLTCGGSSGGEGALIAMRGSILGIGTDMGGSIRAPSAFCGIYGLKPSVGRLPHGGLAGLHAGMENLIGVCGPMATCFEDLRLFCDVVLRSQPWRREPAIIEKPWAPLAISEVPTRLKIGVMWHDGQVQPHPPVTRCLQQAVRELRAAGHIVVPWDSQYHQALVKCASRSNFIDAGQEFHDALKHGREPPVPVVKWILNSVDHLPLTVRETWKLNQERQALQNSYAAQWNTLGLDAIICPVHPASAPAIHEAKYSGYTSAFNILDYAAAVLPVGQVNPTTDTWESFPPEHKEPLNEMDAYFRSTYSGPAKYLKAPVSLQIVTRRLQEERLLAILEKISVVVQHNLNNES